MRKSLSLALAASVVVLGACGAEPSPGFDEGIRVEARQAVVVTDEPLGDVVEGEIDAGDAATALCFVSKARTNTGATGEAIKIESGAISGYAAVTDFPKDPADRVMVFDVNDSDLRARLPSCLP